MVIGKLKMKMIIITIIDLQVDIEQILLKILNQIQITIIIHVIIINQMNLVII